MLNYYYFFIFERLKLQQLKVEVELNLSFNCTLCCVAAASLVVPKRQPSVCNGLFLILLSSIWQVRGSGYMRRQK